VRSDPPGAEVVLDGRSVGTTPYEEEFQWYGTHRLELRLPGYRRQVQLLLVERPWWQVFPFSFFTEVLWPYEILDEHGVEFSLQTLPELSSAEVDAACRAAYERLVAVRALAPGGSQDALDDDVEGGGQP